MQIGETVFNHGVCIILTVMLTAYEFRTEQRSYYYGNKKVTTNNLIAAIEAHRKMENEYLESLR